MKIEFDQLPEVRQEYLNETIVFRGGCFDLLHEGHVEGLKFAKDLGDILVVGISSDERIKQRKGESRPIISELSRLAVVDAIRYVDFSFLAPTPEDQLPIPTIRAITALRPDIFVEHDQNAGRWPQEDLNLFAVLGTQMVVDVRPYGISTTKIINKIRDYQVEKTQTG